MFVLVFVAGSFLAPVSRASIALISGHKVGG